MAKGAGPASQVWTGIQELLSNTQHAHQPIAPPQCVCFNLAVAKFLPHEEEEASPDGDAGPQVLRRSRQSAPWTQAMMLFVRAARGE